MRLSVLAAAFVIACPVAAVARQSPTPPAATADLQLSAAPADVDTPESIVATLYAVISGDAGVERDWDRFRSLFHPTARLIPTGINEAGQGVLRSLTPEEYIVRSRPAMMGDGFHEREISRRIERFGRIAHVWSTYDARRSADSTVAFTRGINSIQLLHDGKRWWILSVYWQAESEAAPLPPTYLTPVG